MYRFAIGFILISIYGNAQAQVDVKTAVLDSITYTQFVEKNWASLLDSTNQILKRNEGFYNLYLRAAIAANALLTGQPTFALFASSRNFSSVISGTSPSQTKWIDMILNPLPVFSSFN